MRTGVLCNSSPEWPRSFACTLNLSSGSRDKDLFDLLRAEDQKYSHILFLCPEFTCPTRLSPGVPSCVVFSVFPKEMWPCRTWHRSMIRTPAWVSSQDSLPLLSWWAAQRQKALCHVPKPGGLHRWRTEWGAPEGKNSDGPIFPSNLYSLALARSCLRYHFSLAWGLFYTRGFSMTQFLGSGQEALCQNSCVGGLGIPQPDLPLRSAPGRQTETFPKPFNDIETFVSSN